LQEIPWNVVPSSSGAGLAGVLAAGAIVHAQANIRWRLTSSFPKALDTICSA
jgi:TRAP-type mannitol/chloroaromatic compound transport system substrate-binding protein